MEVLAGFYYVTLEFPRPRSLTAYVFLDGEIDAHILLLECTSRNEEVGRLETQNR